MMDGIPGYDQWKLQSDPANEEEKPWDDDARALRDLDMIVDEFLMGELSGDAREKLIEFTQRRRDGGVDGIDP